MPELLVDYITSLDGYGAADGWPGFWGLEGPEYLAWLEDEPEADYIVLMGANTYRLMSGLAEEGEPGTEGLAGLSKVVFSSGPHDRPCCAARSGDDLAGAAPQRCHPRRQAGVPRDGCPVEGPAGRQAPQGRQARHQR